MEFGVNVGLADEASSDAMSSDASREAEQQWICWIDASTTIRWMRARDEYVAVNDGSDSGTDGGGSGCDVSGDPGPMSMPVMAGGWSM